MTQTLDAVTARHRLTLDNGLRVVVEEDHNTPAVAVNLWYGVGSRHEQEGRTGLAHLFEHLMFQGSAHVASGEHFAVLDALGADLNATTSHDRTNYFETVPREGLDLALWLEADRMGGLLAALDQKNLDNQRDVVRNERRQRMDNQPYGTMWERLFAAMFAAGHQYHHLPIGSMEDLAAATLDDVRDFFTRHYTPANAVLSLVGDVTADEARARVERYFGGIDRGPDVATRAPQTSANRGTRIDVTDEVVPAPMVVMAWPTPSDGDPTAHALDLAGTTLAGAESSRLAVELIRRKEIATFVGGGLDRLVGGHSVFTLMVQGRDGVEPQRLLDEILEITDHFAVQGPTGLEQDIARAATETSFLMARQTLADRADSLSHGLSLFGDPGYDENTLAAVVATDSDTVRSVVAEQLRPDDATILTYTPSATKES